METSSGFNEFPWCWWVSACRGVPDQSTTPAMLNVKSHQRQIDRIVHSDEARKHGQACVSVGAVDVTTKSNEALNPLDGVLQGETSRPVNSLRQR
ncbi:Hypothetical protein SMAX5B_004498 [Scophthalmus maximus]|uniref:Uncharacterized protein n=1 Tax=Scophthalmus maximus TaxID=52904 RepID=A0A2U9B0C9_SCOMX|nr:Hypothetical protein SMAX5B_004498 [Scophthalmus maximus]